MLFYELFKLDRSFYPWWWSYRVISQQTVYNRIHVYARHDIWQLPRHVRALDTRCMTSPVCPGEYSCEGQAINGISGNERCTKTRPETRFDCWTSNASGVVEQDRGGLRRVSLTYIHRTL